MHRTPTPDQAHYSCLVDAQSVDLARYLDLHTGLARVELDTAPFAIPRIDGEARARQVRNGMISGLDEATATATGAAPLFVGSVL